MVIAQGHVSHHKSSHLEMGRMTDTYQLQIHSHDDLQGTRHLRGGGGSCLGSPGPASWEELPCPSFSTCRGHGGVRLLQSLQQ